LRNPQFAFPGVETPGYFQLSLRDLRNMEFIVPGVETPGYFQLSLRDNPQSAICNPQFPSRSFSPPPVMLAAWKSRNPSNALIADNALI
jgi:hypothetical protein